MGMREAASQIFQVIKEQEMGLGGVDIEYESAIPVAQNYLRISPQEVKAPYYNKCCSTTLHT